MRQIVTIHEVWERTIKGQRRILLAPHKRWTQNDRPVLSAFTKKLQGSVESTQQALRAEQFAGTPPRPRLLIPLESYTVLAHSPTARELTEYTVFPFLVRFAPSVRPLGVPDEHWLTREEALARPDLSPTVRGLLLQSPRCQASPDSLESRVLHARYHDHAAVWGLLMELADDLLRTASRLLPSLEDQNDAVSNAILRAWNNIHSFVPGTSLKKWLRRIVQHQALDILRRQAVRRHDPLDRATEAADSTPGPDALAASSERAAHIRSVVRRVLAQRPPRERLVWRLYIDEGLDYSDITDLPDINYRLATQTVHRIRQQLRHELQGLAC